MPNSPQDYLQQGERANQRLTQHEKDCAERYEDFTKEVTALKGDIKNLNTRVEHLDEKIRGVGAWVKGGVCIISLFLTVITILVGIIAL